MSGIRCLITSGVRRPRATVTNQNCFWYFVCRYLGLILNVTSDPSMCIGYENAPLTCDDHCRHGRDVCST